MTTRVAVDGRVLAPAYHGIGRVVFELTRALCKHPDLDVVLFVGDQVSDRFDVESLANSGAVEVRPIDAPLFAPSHLWRVERALQAAEADVAMFGYHIAAPVRRGTPRVVMVHDCIFEADPAFSPSTRMRLGYRAATAAVLRNSRVATVSQASAADIERHYGPRHVDIVSNGIDPTFATLGTGIDAAGELRLPQRYLLAVGARRPHKNIECIIRALPGMPDDIGLVLVGTVDDRFVDPLPELIDRLGVFDRVRHIRSVSEATLSSLYCRATAVLCPSRIEGFGLPLLEAMACRAPLVASDIPVFREIADGAAWFASPTMPSRWSAAVNDLLAADDERENKLTVGEQRAAAYSWERAADTMAIALGEASRSPSRVNGFRLRPSR